MRLIERESHLAALREYAKEASRGQGRLVLISGEAGVGKSVLLEEFAQETQGARWLWAGCDGLFAPAALGPLLDIASELDGDSCACAGLGRNEISCMAHCYVRSATPELSPSSPSRTCTGPMRRRWIC